MGSLHAMVDMSTGPVEVRSGRLDGVLIERKNRVGGGSETAIAYHLAED